MSHELESPNQASLDTLFADAHVLRITDERESSLFVEVRGDDVCAVRDMLRIHEHDNPPACYCVGGPWIEIYGRDRSFRARLAIHHALSLENWGRYGGQWYTQGRLMDGLALHHWLAARGVRKPLDLEERRTQHSADTIAAKNR